MLLFLLLTLATALAAPQRKYYSQPYQAGKFVPIISDTNEVNPDGTFRQKYYSQPYQSGNYVPIISETNEISPDGTFSYSYATGDGQQAQAQGYLKNAGVKDQEAEVIQGSYSYTAPDGTPITVTYIADENGFRAEGAHLPTPPPIPEAIQRSLDLIGQTQRNPQYQPQFQRPRPFSRF